MGCSGEPGDVRNRWLFVIAAISVMMDARVVSPPGAVRRVVMVAYPAVQILEPEIMRRAFVRTVHVSPTQYRQRFRRV